MDPSEVIADRKVENDSGILTRKSKAPVQRMDQNPRFEVLGEETASTALGD